MNIRNLDDEAAMEWAYQFAPHLLREWAQAPYPASLSFYNWLVEESPSYARRFQSWFQSQIEDKEDRNGTASI